MIVTVDVLDCFLDTVAFIVVVVVALFWGNGGGGAEEEGGGGGAEEEGGGLVMVCSLCARIFFLFSFWRLFLFFFCFFSPLENWSFFHYFAEPR